MRIVSLLPAATEIVGALGLEDQLVAVTAACNWPPEILGRPMVTHFSGGRREPAVGLLDEDELADARPDLVIAGPKGGLGIAGRRSLDEVLKRIAPSSTLLTLEPASLEGIFNSIVSIGAMTEAEDEAIGLVELMREDLQDIEERQADRRGDGRPPVRVVALERLDPPTAAGLWVPELIRRAGGWDLLGSEGEPARELSWEAVRDVDPEILVVLNEDQKTSEILYAEDDALRPDWWTEIGAVRESRVFAVEGVFFSRPGPRIIDGLAILAEIFDPEGFGDASPPGSWSPVFSAADR